MDSFALVALIGTVSTAALGVLAIFEKWRPYALFVLAASAFVGFSAIRGEGQLHSFLEFWLILFFAMLGTQVALAPFALAVFLFKRQKKAPPKGAST